MKKIGKTVAYLRLSFVSALIITLLMSFSLPCYAATSARGAVNSVVMVFTEFTTVENGIETPYSGWGSGFAIGETGQPIQYIVTNYHVVKDAADNNGDISVYFSVAANKYMQTEVFWKNEAKDIAILKLPEPTNEREALILRMSQDIDFNDTYSALGYPYTETMINTLPKFDTSDITITRGSISKTTRINQTEYYLLDLAIDHGNSGGPLVNSAGEVVGINTFGIDKESNTTAYYALTIDELIKNIDRSVIPYTLYGELTLTMLIVLIGSGVAGIILMSILIMMVRKNIRKKQAMVIFTAGRKVCSIIGLTGSYKGQRIELTKQLVFGRDDRKCNVIFPMDTPGISAVHCSVCIEGGEIYLMDKNSTFGTFYGNGIKLVPNHKTKLHNGDIFYLSSEDCKFEIIQ